jgi:sugar lactone lactonase YvrE
LGCAESHDLDAPGAHHVPIATDGATGAGGAAADASADATTPISDAATGGGDLDAGGGTTEPVTYPMLSASQIGTAQQIASGFTLAEGPLWDPCEHRLLFTDVTASKIHALGADGKVSDFMSDTNNANGIAFDIDGSLILAQMGGGQPGHIARRAKNGMVEQVDPRNSMLHTPDDVVVSSGGTIYFSDGNFPLFGGGSFDFGPMPVYAIKHGSSMLIDGGTVMGPNGIELSPDERTLYVDAYYDGSVLEFDVAADGTPKLGAPLITGLTNPDSLCLDAAGNLYVGVSGGLQVIRPDGGKVAMIAVMSAQGVTNCTFGGADGKTLYITAWTTLWKVDAMPIPGLDWVVNQKRLKCEE